MTGGRPSGHIRRVMPLVDAIDPGPRRRVALVVALLAVALACVAALAFQAYRAQRSHRAAVERALEETVGFAAWSYAGAARRALGSHLFDHGFERMEAIGVPDGGAGLAALLDGPSPLHHGEIRYGFRRDLRSGAVEIVGDAPRAAVRFVEDSLLDAGYDPRWHVGATVLEEASSVLAWRLHPKSGGRPAAAYGFGVPWTAVERLLEEAFVQVELLPPGSVEGRARREPFGVAVTAPGGATFRAGSPPPPGAGPLRAVDTLGSGFAELEVALAADPAALRPLPGTPPPGPGWPLYAGLFALVAALTIAVALLVRREQKLARARTDFVSSVTHAFRTPLAQIRLWGETLALGRERSADERERALRVILREADRLDRMVDDVLAFVRSGDADRRAERTPTDLVAMTRETVEGFRDLAEPRGTGIRFEADGRAVAHVDPTAIRRAVANLVDNALEYGPPDQTVTVRVDHADGRIRIAVEDEGPGVPAEGRARIWRPFERLDAHRSTGGAGIGLAVVERIAADHGGTARVEDRPGGGARFVLTLRAAESEAP